MLHLTAAALVSTLSVAAAPGHHRQQLAWALASGAPRRPGRWPVRPNAAGGVRRLPMLRRLPAAYASACPKIRRADCLSPSRTEAIELVERGEAADTISSERTRGGGGGTRNTSRTSGDEEKWKRDKGAAGEEKRKRAWKKRKFCGEQMGSYTILALGNAAACRVCSRLLPSVNSLRRALCAV
eukprot:scaffold93333_cov67-Phaeocystis_antarctica.AAC.1